MSSLYEKSQGTKIQITSAPATLDTIGAATWLDLHCTIKEVQFTGGQKQDIDVTTLCSTEQENINGLALSQKSLCPVTSMLTRHRMRCVKLTITTPRMVFGLSSRLVLASSSCLKFVSTPGLQGQTAWWLQRSRYA